MKKINPNRMELLKLKKRLKIAERGHKLLKDKLDELMKHFLALIHKNNSLRPAVNTELQKAYQLLSMSRSQVPLKVIEQALSHPKTTMEVEYSFKSLLNIQVPTFKLAHQGDLKYSLITTPASLDNALVAIKEVMPKLVEMAELENSIKLLALEIEKTRRRVNALEYVLIPQLQQTSKFITMKLDEVERDARTRQLKIKEMVSA